MAYTNIDKPEEYFTTILFILVMVLLYLLAV
jgi:hypothetical protein